jgi:hypothetical protein
MVVICSQNGEWEHYNQSPDGWNGFATVAEYYNTFNAADTRAKYSPTIIASYGNQWDIKLGNNLLRWCYP